MARVDLDPSNYARRPEAHDGPVVSRPAAALRFPSIGHVTRVAGHDQIVTRTEKHVAARDDEAAMLGGGEIDVAALCEPNPVGDHLTVDPKPRDAAVRKDPEAHMSRFWRIADGE